MTSTTGRFASSLGRDFKHAHLWYPWNRIGMCIIFYCYIAVFLKRSFTVYARSGTKLREIPFTIQVFMASFPGPSAVQPVSNLAPIKFSSAPKGLNCAFPRQQLWRMYPWELRRDRFSKTTASTSYLRDAASKTNHNHTQHPLHLWVFVANQSYFFNDHACLF